MSEEVLGERDLIRRISEILGGVENDDCAVIDAGDVVIDGSLKGKLGRLERALSH